MIRGHIELVTRSRVAGWAHSDLVPLAGMRVLAFIHDDCVGAGTVDVFRQDLAAAGLGDGIAGFSFSIYLKASQDPRVLDIRLDGSNARICQAETRLIPREEIGAQRRRTPCNPLELSWMLTRGWLSQEQYEALRLLGQFGVYSQRLRLSGGDSLDSERWKDLVRMAGDFMQLHMHLDVTVSLHADVLPDTLPGLHRQMHEHFPAVPPVVGLWTPAISCLNVVEGSHLHPQIPDIGGGGVDHEFGNDRLLWINLDALFSVPTGGLNSPLLALVPTR